MRVLRIVLGAGLCFWMVAVAWSQQQATEDSNLPPKEVGVYWQGQDNKWMALDGQSVSQAKTGGKLGAFATGGLKGMQFKAYIDGSGSSSKVSGPRPVFYIYAAEGLSPSDYRLIRLEVKGKRREFQVGSTSGFGGVKSGLKESSMREFGSERVAPRTFKVTPKTDLETGEYGFYLAGGQALMGGRIYDFSVGK